jgi:lysophospholipase L1-like esterase
MVRKVKKFLDKRRRIGRVTIGVGLASAAALVVFLVAMVRRSGASSTRSRPGSGRTAVIGDSIVANTYGFVRYLGQNVSGRSFDNFGVVGQGTASILNDLRTKVIGHGYNEVIIEGGLNDLGRQNAVEYVTGNLRAMVQEARAAGLGVVLVTVTPYRAGQPKISQINQILMRDGRGWGADIVVDVTSPLADMFGGIKSNLTDDSTGLHPNHTGQELIGQTLLSRAYAN